MYVNVSLHCGMSELRLVLPFNKILCTDTNDCYVYKATPMGRRPWFSRGWRAMYIYLTFDVTLINYNLQKEKQSISLFGLLVPYTSTIGNYSITTCSEGCFTLNLGIALRPGLFKIAFTFFTLALCTPLVSANFNRRPIVKMSGIYVVIFYRWGRGRINR